MHEKKLSKKNIENRFDETCAGSGFQPMKNF